MFLFRVEIVSPIKKNYQLSVLVEAVQVEGQFHKKEQEKEEAKTN